MKLMLKVFMVLIFTFSVVGCGCEKKDKDNNSSIDNKQVIPDKISREENDFEKLDQKVVGYYQDGDYYYEIIVYFDKDKATNAVMTVVCPNVDSAVIMKNAMQNFNQNDEVYYKGKTVVYTYNEEEFPYKNLSKEETINILKTDNFKIK